jgi:hypothetical protein
MWGSTLRAGKMELDVTWIRSQAICTNANFSFDKSKSTVQWKWNFYTLKLFAKDCCLMDFTYKLLRS